MKKDISKRIVNKDGMLFLDGIRMGLINHDYTLQIYLKLKSLVGPVARTILFSAAKESSKIFLKQVFKKKLTARVALKTYAGRKKIFEKMATEYYPLVGYGLVDVVKFEKDEIIIRNTNCIYQSTADKPAFRETGCFTDVAVIEGALEVIMGKPYVGKETKCVLRGDKYCEFKFSPKSKLE